jgi:hypothetical protein
MGSRTVTQFLVCGKAIQKVYFYLILLFTVLFTCFDYYLLCYRKPGNMEMWTLRGGKEGSLLGVVYRDQIRTAGST